MACKYGDPICPCQEGDPCHYEPHGDTPAMHVSPECVLRALGAEREACALLADEKAAGWRSQANASEGEDSVLYHRLANVTGHIGNAIRNRSK